MTLAVDPAAQGGGEQDDALHRLSQLVSGNKNLIDQPGLVQALFQNNATPAQAGAIDQFMGGLQAETKVRAASMGGNKIPLTNLERQQLDLMGIDYTPVWDSPQDQIDKLTQQMAAQGVQPVRDANGNIQTDANGNPLTQEIPKKKKGRGFFGSIGHFLGNNPVTSLVTHGTLIPGSNDEVGNQFNGVVGVAHAANSLYTATSALVSRGNELSDPAAFGRASEQNADLMRNLGYDPSNPLSVLAFSAQGYEHNDTTPLANQWDTENPSGLFGWTGSQAVSEAEQFAANPEQYRRTFLADDKLTDQEKAQRVDQINSPQFVKLVRQLNGKRANIGVDVANGIGLDPVKDSGLYTATSVGTDLLASFFIDPLAVGLGAANAVNRTNAAIQSFQDGTRIGQILDSGSKVGQSMAAFRVQQHLNGLVDTANRIRTLNAAGETDKAAAAVAGLSKSNPYAGLLPDVLGENQILRTMTSSELKRLKPGDLPKITGPGEPLDTYDKLAGYIVSQNALMRLQGGLAPVEATVMPGALSSLGYKQVRGSIAEWRAGRLAQKATKREDKFISWASNPTRVDQSLKAGLLKEVLPQADDAVDVLKQQVIAAEGRLATNELLAQHWATESADSANRMNIAKIQGQKSGQWRKDWGDLQSNAGMATAAHGKALGEVETAKSELASAQRALEERTAQLEAGPMYQLTDAARGDIAFNLRAFGSPTPGSSFQAGNIVLTPRAFTPAAIAARARLAASRFANQLPQDTRITLASADSVDSIGKMAATYMSPGDVARLKLRYALGDGENRQRIVDGLKEMLAHASGMTRTKAGQDLLKQWRAADQKYATNGRGVLDSNGSEAALFPGQVQEHAVLPNFGKMHQAAAKIGLYEATLGNIFNIPILGHALGMWRMLVLSTQVTAYRAAIEGWLNAGANGMFADSLRAKALLKDLDGLKDLAGRSRAVDKLANFGPLRMMGRMYRSGLVKQFDGKTVDEMNYYIDHILQPNLLEQASSHAAAYIDPSGTLGVKEAAESNLAAKHFTVNPALGWSPEIRQVRTGFDLTDELDGMAGAGKYADALGQRTTDPELTNRMLDRITDPATFGPEHVVEGMQSKTVKRLADQMQFGKVFWDSDGIQRKAVTDAEKALGKTQFVDRMTSEFRELLTGRNGRLNDKLVQKIRKDGTPSEDWIHANVKGMDRPQAVLAPRYEPVVQGGKTDFIQSLENVSGKAYQLLVERFIQRHLTSPLHSAAYLDAKAGLEGYKASLIADGIGEDAAQQITAELANRQAWARVARMVDDPRLKLQMDVVGRSFFAFSRATTMMLRRWGQTAWANPQAARRMQLAAEAGVHSGLVQKDTNGNWIFKVPMSGAAMEVINDAIRNIPGFRGAASFPVADLTGNVTSIIPGSTDPFQYGTTPLVSLGGRQLASMFPPDAREVFDRLDTLFNGSAGQGRGVVDTLIPTFGKRISEVLDNDERNSMTSSSMIGSLYNLYATGQVPDETASDVEWDDFYRRLKTQTKNQLWVRAAFALFSPARLDNVEAAGPEADFAYQLTGANGLRDEFKQLLNDTGGDFGSALAVWAYVHPDEVVYSESGSEGSTSNANLPATQEALHWMDRNSGFISKYQHVSAYFMPEGRGDYSQSAYRAQLEAGLRRRKTPTQFYQDVRKVTDGDEYYAVEDKYHSDQNAALAAGNTTLAKKQTADWLAWSKQYKAVHPIFAADLASWSDTRNTANGQLADLHSMVQNGDVPGGQGPAVAGMLQAYDGYVEFAQKHAGGTAIARAQRSAAFSQLQEYMTAVVTQNPGLKDLYQGVFRKLNSNLENENDQGAA